MGHSVIVEKLQVAKEIISQKGYAYYPQLKQAVRVVRAYYSGKDIEPIELLY